MQVGLAPEVETRLRKVLRSAGQREVGGMLFGEQLAPGQFRVIDLSMDTHSGSHANFRRDPAVHKQALDAFFDRTNRDFSRFNYLGEWHSHPSFSVRPSAKDVVTMTALVTNERTAIFFAALLIVRLRFHFWLERSWMVFERGRPPHIPGPIVRWI